MFHSCSQCTAGSGGVYMVVPQFFLGQKDHIMFHSVGGTVKQCSQKGKVSEDFFPQSEMKIWPKRRSSLKFSAGLFKVGVGTFMIFF